MPTHNKLPTFRNAASVALLWLASVGASVAAAQKIEPGHSSGESSAPPKTKSWVAPVNSATRPGGAWAAVSARKTPFQPTAVPPSTMQTA